MCKKMVSLGGTWYDGTVTLKYRTFWDLAFVAFGFAVQ